jgi:hypothetical protein
VVAGGEGPQGVRHQPGRVGREGRPRQAGGPAEAHVVTAVAVPADFDDLERFHFTVLAMFYSENKLYMSLSHGCDRVRKVRLHICVPLFAFSLAAAK